MQPRAYDYPDSHDTSGYIGQPSNPYGTFPGPANHYAPR